MNDQQIYIALNYSSILEKLAESKEFIPSVLLAKYIRKSLENSVLSPEVTYYICEYLEGNIKPSKGRKSLQKADKARRDMLVTHFYKDFLTQLQKTSKENWPSICDDYINLKDYRKPSANELAARIVASIFLSGPNSYRTAQKIYSAHKKERIKVKAMKK